MTSVKVKFRPSKVDGEPGKLFYQIITKRVTRQIGTCYQLTAAEWDEHRRGLVRAGGGLPRERLAALHSMQKRVRRDVACLRSIIAKLEEADDAYTADDVVRRYHKHTDERSLTRFVQQLVARHAASGHERTAETYASTLRSFTRFNGGRDVRLDEIDADLMLRYEGWLRARRLTANTISFYMRILRAAYNRAVELRLVEQDYPFRHVYTGIEQTAKRAIPLKKIRAIKLLNLPHGSHLDLARDLFLFSFYTRGMSFIDMAFLLKKDVKHGRLTYRRRKTGQLLRMKWEPCRQAIVDKHRATDTPYLLPIIVRDGQERRQYETALRRVNRLLKFIAREVDLPESLTMYVARHSWAGAAQDHHIPLSVISEGMGHTSEQTTRIYLAALDTAIVDKANRKILENL